MSETIKIKQNEQNEQNKLVVFDMDETLGYFSQLYVIWISLIKLSKTKLSIFDFYALSDIYIFYYHPTIFKILKFLKENNIETIIFTNNQAQYWWPNLVAHYLNYKVIGEQKKDSKNNVFKTVIGSYVLQNKINDHRRTSMMKKYDDLKNIMKLKCDTKILFIDDQEHPEMRHSKIDYFKVPGYIVMLPPQHVINIFLHSNLGKKFIYKNNISINFFIKYIFIAFNNYNLTTKSIIKINNNRSTYNNFYKKIIIFVKGDIETAC
jgi:hypothetical protein